MYHTFISINFRKFISENLTTAIFNKVKNEIGDGQIEDGYPEFNSENEYKKYWYTNNHYAINTSSLSVYDAHVLALMFKINIHILHCPSATMFNFIGNPNSNDTILLINKGGGHYNITLYNHNDDNNDGDVLRPIFNDNSVKKGGKTKTKTKTKRRHYSKQKSKTSRK
jgi:hypothetical protein